MALADDGSMDDVKELVYDSIQELISEGRISPQTSAADLEDISEPVKRRRQGICYRRGRAGKKMIRIPYRCWKDWKQRDAAQKLINVDSAIAFQFCVQLIYITTMFIQNDSQRVQIKVSKFRAMCDREGIGLCAAAIDSCSRLTFQSNFQTFFNTL